MDGILIIDKPAGPTSHDIVKIVKRITGARKVGHLGTLDPQATGVLPLALNGATKRAKDLAGKEKIYEFTLKLGVRTSTDDDAGNVLSKNDVPPDFLKKLEAIIPDFVGETMQQPPAYSAVKVNGLRAYELARLGRVAMLEPRQVFIDSISIINTEGTNVRLRLECRSGTYVRSLCRDLGAALGPGGHASGIRRLKSGKYTIEAALTLEGLAIHPDAWKEKVISVP